MKDRCRMRTAAHVCVVHRARAFVDREPRERELTGMQLRERRAGESVKAHAPLEDNAGLRVVRGPQLPQEQSDYVEFHDDYHLYNQTQSQQPGGIAGRVAHMHTPNRHVGQVIAFSPMLGASQSLCYSRLKDLSQTYKQVAAPHVLPCFLVPVSTGEVQGSPHSLSQQKRGSSGNRLLTSTAASPLNPLHRQLNLSVETLTNETEDRRHGSRRVFGNGGHTSSRTLVWSTADAYAGLGHTEHAHSPARASVAI